MSLKRRNFIALILILLSALAFAFGQKILGIYIGSGGGYPEFSSTLESGSFGAVTDGDIEGSTHSTATSSTEMTFGDIGSELDSSSGDEVTAGVTGIGDGVASGVRELVMDDKIRSISSSE